MLVHTKDLLVKAREEGYAVGAFNTSNLEITQAIIGAAEKLQAPVIIQTSAKAIEYAGLEEIYALVMTEINTVKTKAVLHLDHAKTFELIKKTIDIGYPSVMIDGSKLSFDENVHLTKRVVKYAHTKGVSVEAEIGKIGLGEEGVKEGESNYTDPDEARKFYQLTLVDSLAISVGNAHGAPEGEKVNLDLIEKIADKVPIPLVLHGSSGLSPKDIKGAVERGISKINIDTKIRQTAIKSIGHSIEDSSKDYRDVLENMREDVLKIVEEYIELLGSKGKG